MRSFHPSIINIAEGSIFRPPGGKKFLKIYRTYPQGSAQLLPGEGACVTFYAVRSMERGSMAVGDFSTSLRYVRNDSERVHWSFFLTIISREVVKKGCLCNINVWRRKSGNSMEGFYSHLSCISRIFRPECSFDRQEAMNPCIQASDFSPPCPGAQGRGNGFCRFSKKYDNKIKTRIPSLAA